MRVLRLCGFLVFVTCLAIALFFARRRVRYQRMPTAMPPATHLR